MEKKTKITAELIEIKVKLGEDIKKIIKEWKKLTNDELEQYLDWAKIRYEKSCQK